MKQETHVEDRGRRQEERDTGAGSSTPLMDGRDGHFGEEGEVTVGGGEAARRIQPTERTATAAAEGAVKEGLTTASVGAQRANFLESQREGQGSASCVVS